MKYGGHIRPTELCFRSLLAVRGSAIFALCTLAIGCEVPKNEHGTQVINTIALKNTAIDNVLKKGMSELEVLEAIEMTHTSVGQFSTLSSRVYRCRSPFVPKKSVTLTFFFDDACVWRLDDWVICERQSEQWEKVDRDWFLTREVGLRKLCEQIAEKKKESSAVPKQ